MPDEILYVQIIGQIRELIRRRKSASFILLSYRYRLAATTSASIYLKPILGHIEGQLTHFSRDTVPLKAFSIQPI